MSAPRAGLIASALAVAAWLAAGAALAQGGDVHIDLRSGSVTRLPIRCLSLTPAGDRNAGTGSVQADEVLATDLQNSAVFAVTRGWMASLPGAPEPQAEIAGKWTVNGSQVRLSGEVHDWPGRKPILVQEYRGSLSEWRHLVHRFADDIVMQFTGEPGVSDTRIAYVVQEGRTKELWVMDADGGSPTQITRDGSLAQSPAWAPDASLLLFTSWRGGMGPQLWVISPEVRRPFLVSGRPGINTSPAYSPDGRGIVCTLSMDGNAEIYRLDARGGSPQRLTNGRSIETSPCWSPTGREIAFTSDRSGSPSVHIMDADGGSVRRLTYELAYTDSPAWSPKGDRIAFVARVDAGFDLWMCRPDGGDLVRIATGGANENPHWSPDARHLVFSSDRDGPRALWITDLDGAPPRKLETGARVSLSPAWSPRSGPAAPHEKEASR
jgi:TolB protein